MAGTEVVGSPSLKNKTCDDAVIFASSLIEQVNREDVASMVYIQRDMLSRFEKTNEMLINFNILSASRYEATVKDFQKHTQLLFDMKKDLDTVFKRVRVLKQRLEKVYPDAFAACSSIYAVASDSESGEDDDSDEEDVTTVPPVMGYQSATAKEDLTSLPGQPEPPLVTVTGSPTTEQTATK